MMHPSIVFINRLGGIFTWIGIWNIIIYFVEVKNLVGNIILATLGIIIWILTGEFDHISLSPGER